MVAKVDEAKIILVAGLAFGDEGKGATVDWLARRTDATLVVRYNGGSQASHRVVTDDGREHVFSQFGSGSFCGTRTFLSRYVAVDPLALVAEGWALARTLGQEVPPIIDADRKCLMVTPWHKAANRLRELGRGANRHGSCGMGVGETVRVSIEHPELAPRLGELRTFDKFQPLREHLRAEVEPWLHLDAEEAHVLNNPDSCWRFRQRLRPFYAMCGMKNGLEIRPSDRTVIFEGAQGVLLDQDHGLGAPDHATWSKTNFDNADVLLDELGISKDDVYRLGVIRTHLTRHGAGPFPTEASIPLPMHEHNSDGPWQGSLRIGWHSAELLHLSASTIGQLDGLAVTHCDYPRVGVTALYMERAYNAPIVVCSVGPTAADRRINK